MGLRRFILSKKIGDGFMKKLVYVLMSLTIISYQSQLRSRTSAEDALNYLMAGKEHTSTDVGSWVVAASNAYQAAKEALKKKEGIDVYLGALQVYIGGLNRIANDTARGSETKAQDARKAATVVQGLLDELKEELKKAK